MRERLEPQAPEPLRRGLCDWCGKSSPRGRCYCSPACQRSYNNLLTRQAKPIMQMLKIWRLHRGRAGSRGEGRITAISERVDAALREDRARWLAEGDG